MEGLRHLSAPLHGIHQMNVSMFLTLVNGFAWNLVSRKTRLQAGQRGFNSRRGQW